MFSLEHELTRWRTGYLKDRTFTGEDIDELEAHLLDAFDTLRESGVNERDAFDLALSSMGDRSVLRKEFKRAQPWWERAFRVSRALYLGLSALFTTAAILYWQIAETSILTAFSHGGSLFFSGIKILTSFVLPVVTLFLAFYWIDSERLRKAGWITIGLMFAFYVGKFYLWPGHWELLSRLSSPASTSFFVLFSSLFLKERVLFQTAKIWGVIIALLHLPPLIHFLLDAQWGYAVVKTLTAAGDVGLGLLLGYALSRPTNGLHLQTSR